MKTLGGFLTGRPAFILITVEEETVGDKLSNGRIASYVSDQDPDFVPSDASADSAEEDSEGEEAIVEKIEDTVEEVVK